MPDPVQITVSSSTNDGPVTTQGPYASWCCPCCLKFGCFCKYIGGQINESYVLPPGAKLPIDPRTPPSYPPYSSIPGVYNCPRWQITVILDGIGDGTLTGCCDHMNGTYIMKTPDCDQVSGPCQNFNLPSGCVFGCSGTQYLSGCATSPENGVPGAAQCAPYCFGQQYFPLGSYFSVFPSFEDWGTGHSFPDNGVAWILLLTSGYCAYLWDGQTPPHYIDHPYGCPRATCAGLDTIFYHGQSVPIDPVTGCYEILGTYTLDQYYLEPSCPTGFNQQTQQTIYSPLCDYPGSIQITAEPY